MPKEKILVSVVISVYNGEKYVGDAIESILNQTYRNFELILIDDCSTDSSYEIIKRYAKQDSRIKVLKNQDNLKIAKSLNKAIKTAKGKYIVKMDADDWSYPTRIEKQVEFMEKNPNVVLSSTNMTVCDENLQRTSSMKLVEKPENIRKVLLHFNPMSHPSMIYRTQEFFNAGAYDEKILKGSADDYHLVIRMSSLGDLANIPEELVKYRVLRTSETQVKQRDMQLATVYGVLKAYLELGYSIDFKAILILIIRFFIACLIPPLVWRSLSTFIRK